MTAAEYSFRPALLRRAVTYRVGPDRLTRFGANGQENWSLRLSEITEFGYARTRIQTRVTTLTVHGPWGKRTVSRNAPLRLGTDDPDGRAFRGLVHEILRVTATHDPDIRVHLGLRGGQDVAMFVVGLLMLVTIAGFGVAAVATNVSTGRLLDAAAPLLILGVFGAYFAWAHRPMRRRDSMSLRDASDAVG